MEELDSTILSFDHFFKSLKTEYDGNFRAEILSTDFNKKEKNYQKISGQY